MQDVTVAVLRRQKLLELERKGAVRAPPAQDALSNEELVALEELLRDPLAGAHVDEAPQPEGPPGGAAPISGASEPQAEGRAPRGLPYGGRIAAALGIDLSAVRVVGGDAARALTREHDALGAAQGATVWLPPGADLFTVAHEVAHAVQALYGAMPRAGQDVGPWERHADAVARAVVSGSDATPLLARLPQGGSALGTSSDAGAAGAWAPSSAVMWKGAAADTSGRDAPPARKTDGGASMKKNPTPGGREKAKAEEEARRREAANQAATAATSKKASAPPKSKNKAEAPRARAAGRGVDPKEAPAPAKADLGPGQRASRKEVAAPAKSASDAMSQFGAMAPSKQASSYKAITPGVQAGATAAREHAVAQVPELHAKQAEEPLPAGVGGDEKALHGKTSVGKQGAAEAKRQEDPEHSAAEPPAVGGVPFDASAIAGWLSGQEGSDAKDAKKIALHKAQEGGKDIATQPVPPEIKLEGKADTQQADDAHAKATEDAGKAAVEAKQQVFDGPGPDSVRLAKLDVPFEAPKLPEIEVPEFAQAVPGMDKFESYDLPANVQAEFDSHYAPQLQAHVDAATEQAKEAEGKFEADKDAQIAEAERGVDEANADAQAQQEAAVHKARGDIQASRRTALEKQDAAVADVKKEADAERTKTLGDIDKQVRAEKGTIDREMRQAQRKADAEVTSGERKAREEEKKADSKDDSFWDDVVDAVSDFVEGLVEAITAIWEAVRDAVSKILDAAVALANKIIDGIIKFVSAALSAYLDLLTTLVGALLGELFPEIAAWLTEKLQQFKNWAVQKLQELGKFLKEQVKAFAEKLKAGLDALVQGYLNAIKAAATFLEACITGDWDKVLSMTIDAIFWAAGIDRKEFEEKYGPAEAVFEAVIADPSLLVKNAVDATALGFSQFGDNFGKHFGEGAIEWLTGGTGITLPGAFDLKGVFSIVLQVLGINKEFIKGKVEKYAGSKAATVFDYVWDYVAAFMDGGVEGVWELVKDQLTGLWDMVLGQIVSFVTEKAIKRAVQFIATVATGYGAIVEAVIALWNFGTWVYDNIQRIMGIVQTVLKSTIDFVAGNIQPAADKIESLLGNLIPVALDLVAKMLGFGDLPEKSRDLIKGVRDRVDKAIDNVIEKTIARFKGGKGDDKGEEKEGEVNPETVLEEKEPFNVNGESHHTWVEVSGENTEIMVASNPTKLDEVNKTAREGVKDDPDQLTELNKNIKTVEDLAKELKEEANQGTFKKLWQKLKSKLPWAKKVKTQKQRLAEAISKVVGQGDAQGAKWARALEDKLGTADDFLLIVAPLIESRKKGKKQRPKADIQPEAPEEMAKEGREKVMKESGGHRQWMERTIAVVKSDPNLFKEMENLNYMAKQDAATSVTEKKLGELAKLTFESFGGKVESGAFRKAFDQSKATLKLMDQAQDKPGSGLKVKWKGNDIFRGEYKPYDGKDGKLAFKFDYPVSDLKVQTDWDVKELFNVPNLETTGKVGAQIAPSITPTVAEDATSIKVTVDAGARLQGEVKKVGIKLKLGSYDLAPIIGVPFVAAAEPKLYARVDGKMDATGAILGLTAKYDKNLKIWTSEYKNVAKLKGEASLGVEGGARLEVNNILAKLHSLYEECKAILKPAEEEHAKEVASKAKREFDVGYKDRVRIGMEKLVPYIEVPFAGFTYGVSFEGALIRRESTANGVETLDDQFTYTPKVEFTGYIGQKLQDFIKERNPEQTEAYKQVANDLKALEEYAYEARRRVQQKEGESEKAAGKAASADNELQATQAKHSAEGKSAEELEASRKLSIELDSDSRKKVREAELRGGEEEMLRSRIEALKAKGEASPQAIGKLEEKLGEVERTRIDAENLANSALSESSMAKVGRRSEKAIAAVKAAEDSAKRADDALNAARKELEIAKEELAKVDKARGVLKTERDKAHLKSSTGIGKGAATAGSKDDPMKDFQQQMANAKAYKKEQDALNDNKAAAHVDAKRKEGIAKAVAAGIEGADISDYPEQALRKELIKEKTNKIERRVTVSGGGEVHTLHMDQRGNQVVPIMESTPRPIGETLANVYADAKGRLGAQPDGEAKLKEIEKLISQAESVAGEMALAASAELSKDGDHTAQVLARYGRLTSIVERVLELAYKDTPAVKDALDRVGDDPKKKLERAQDLANYAVASGKDVDKLSTQEMDEVIKGHGILLEDVQVGGKMRKVIPESSKNDKLANKRYRNAAGKEFDDSLTGSIGVAGNTQGLKPGEVADSLGLDYDLKDKDENPYYKKVQGGSQKQAPGQNPTKGGMSLEGPKSLTVIEADIDQDMVDKAKIPLDPRLRQRAKEKAEVDGDANAKQVLDRSIDSAQASKTDNASTNEYNPFVGSGRTMGAKATGRKDEGTQTVNQELYAEKPITLKAGKARMIGVDEDGKEVVLAELVDRKDAQGNVVGTEWKPTQHGQGMAMPAAGDGGANRPQKKASSLNGKAGGKPAGQPVQADNGFAGGQPDTSQAQEAFSGTASALPFGSTIQASFGDHDISGVKAHTGGAAQAQTSAMGAGAFASGQNVAFGQAPDLHTAAHEAAHVVQQQAGLAPAGGVGRAGDAFEKNADAAADAVVAGESAADVLDSFVGSGGSAASGASTSGGGAVQANTGDVDAAAGKGVDSGPAKAGGKGDEVAAVAMTGSQYAKIQAEFVVPLPYGALNSAAVAVSASVDVAAGGKATDAGDLGLVGEVKIEFEWLRATIGNSLLQVGINAFGEGKVKGSKGKLLLAEAAAAAGLGAKGAQAVGAKTSNLAKASGLITAGGHAAKLIGEEVSNYYGMGNVKKAMAPLADVAARKKELKAKAEKLIGEAMGAAQGDVIPTLKNLLFGKTNDRLKSEVDAVVQSYTKQLVAGSVSPEEAEKLVSTAFNLPQWDNVHSIFGDLLEATGSPEEKQVAFGALAGLISQIDGDSNGLEKQIADIVADKSKNNQDVEFKGTVGFVLALAGPVSTPVGKIAGSVTVGKKVSDGGGENFKEGSETAARLVVSDTLKTEPEVGMEARVDYVWGSVKGEGPNAKRTDQLDLRMSFDFVQKDPPADAEAALGKVGAALGDLQKGLLVILQAANTTAISGLASVAALIMDYQRGSSAAFDGLKSQYADARNSVWKGVGGLAPKFKSSNKVQLRFSLGFTNVLSGADVSKDLLGGDISLSKFDASLAVEESASVGVENKALGLGAEIKGSVGNRFKLEHTKEKPKKQDQAAPKEAKDGPSSPAGSATEAGERSKTPTETKSENAQAAKATPDKEGGPSAAGSAVGADEAKPPTNPKKKKKRQAKKDAKKAANKADTGAMDTSEKAAP